MIYLSLQIYLGALFLCYMKSQVRDIQLLQAIARRFKVLRAIKGVSQETVYEDTGIHIGKIETAKYNISISTLSKLCKYYQITIVDFFRSLENL
ncbi:helix-turn-helix domain-containing protein [Alistipes sp.]|uniref:helix-turn-helix domain-containing protein n=2 Tax=Alistipes sp. TaxID=1872444 RepID=UPI003AB22C04